MSEISIYIHLPFCKSKCLYCDFLSYSSKGDKVKTYINALINEIKSFSTEKKVKSIFFGGGTPSVIDSKHIVEIMSVLREKFKFSPDIEITIEANPGTVTLKKLKDYIESGINRISFGVQSMNNKLLKTIGRIHTDAEAVEAVQMAQKAGFRNINCDLMFSLPYQSCNDLLDSINKVAALGINHISMYSLIVEEGTVLYDMYENHSLPEIDEAEDRLMYHKGIELLEKKGYYQYEISNFAQKGYECRHNMVYWYRGDYKGFGLGAASLVDNIRIKNTESFDAYISGENNYETEKLTTKDMQEEFMFLGLRCNKGVSETDFYNSFGVEINKIYGSQLDKLVSNGLVSRVNGQFFLTKQGFDLANRVFVEFMQ